MERHKAKFAKEVTELPSAQLTDLLHRELEKNHPDGGRVRQLLRALEAKAPQESMVLTDQERKAWEKFKIDCESDKYHTRYERKSKWIRWIAGAAAAVVLVVFAAGIPKVYGEDNFFDFVAVWTGKAISYFAPNEVQEEYVFVTDSPALQLIYDTVSGFGVTEPVVPMWIPEGFELVEMKETNTPAKIKVYATLQNENCQIIYTMDIFGATGPDSFVADGESFEFFEYNGEIHNVVSNDGSWTATWETKNAIFSLSVEGERAVLNKMIASIYNGG